MLEIALFKYLQRKNNSRWNLKTKILSASACYSLLPLAFYAGVQVFTGQHLSQIANASFIAINLSSFLLIGLAFHRITIQSDRRLESALHEDQRQSLLEQLHDSLEYPGIHALLRQSVINADRVKDLQEKLSEAKNQLAMNEVAHKKELEKAIQCSEINQKRIISVIGHDLKQPLYASTMALANMQRSQAFKDNPSLKEYVNRIDEGLKRASNQLTEFAQASQGSTITSSLSLMPMDIYREIESIHSHLAVTAFAKGLYADFIVDSHLPNMIVSSSQAIRYMVQNVLDNAIKFTKVGGVTLRLSVENVISSSEFTLGISVTDTGPGLLAEQVRAIRARFDNGDGAISLMDSTQGLGLGLDIAMNYLKGLGGNLDIQSSEQGSTIKATMPVKRAIHPVGIEQRVCTSILSKMDVQFVVIDGRETFRAGIASRLANAGADCVQANSLEDLEKFTQHQTVKPAVIILRRLHSEETKKTIGTLKDIRQANPALIISMEKSTEDLDTYEGLSDESADMVVNAATQIAPLLEKVRERIAPVERSLHDIFLDQTLCLEQSTLRGISILLIDDDQTNLEHTAEYLSSYGAKVDIALGAEKGISVAASAAYDVIFVDVMMPGTSGIEAAFVIRNGQVNKDTPIFAFTAASLTDKDKLDISSLDMKVLDKSDARDSIVMLIRTAYVKRKSTQAESEKPARKLRSVR